VEAPPAVRPRLSALAAVALPASVAMLIVVIFAVMEAAGRAPLSTAPQNIAEAAGMGSAAETMRRALYGESAHRVEYVRPEIISARVTRVTALEAAIFSRKLELVRLLDRRGAIVGTGTRLALACLARDIEANDIVEYLARGVELPCAKDAEHERVIARSAAADAP
jgi:hypothetical protein